MGNPFWVYSACLIPATAGTWVILAHLVQLITTEIAVTSSRFIFKTGLVARTTKEVSLNNIEEINLQQSVLGRMFGFDHMTIHGTGVAMFIG